MSRFASSRPDRPCLPIGFSPRFPKVRDLLLAAACLCQIASPAWAQESDEGTKDLTLDELRQWVVERNENVHMRMLEVEISEKVYKAERGIFEPQVVGSVERIDTDRPNNTQQQASLGLFGPSTPVFLEENTLYNAGIEFLLPTGTRLRSGFTLRDLSNNLQYSGSGTNRVFTGPEYEIFVGATIVQPLLKNFGLGPTMAKIRLAALASEVAFQEYRRQLMLMLAQAESAYWELYLAQERARIAQDSVTLSGKILADNKARFEVGKAPELEVLQAEAGVSLRKARLNESRQRIFEVASRISNLYGRTPRQSPARPRASDEPVQLEHSADREDDVLQAFASNPDFRMRQSQLEQEGIRVKYTRNQRLPQLDVRGSYGLNSLGRAVGEAWDDVDSQDYPAWSLAVEMRFPIGGGSKERNEHQAAKIAKERAQVAIREVETQVLNGIDAARRRLQLYAEDVQNYRSVSAFHERLLQTQLDRLAVGGIESVVVLETEEKLSEARTAVVEGLVLYRRSLLELELIRGTLLKTRNLEIDRDQLRSSTRQRLLQSNISVSRAAELEKKAAAEIDHLATRR